MKLLSYIAHVGLALGLFSGPQAGAASYCAEAITPDQLSHQVIQVQRYRDDGNWPSDRTTSTVSLRLPSLDVAVEIADDRFRLIDASGTAVELGRVKSGDQLRGWSDLYDLGGGWVYARSSHHEYDSLLRIEHRSGGWALAENIRIREDERNVAATLVRGGLRTMLGIDVDEVWAEKDNLTSIVAKRDLRFYSPALRTMLFLEDGEKIENGKFVAIGAGPLRWYLGDVTAANVALIKHASGMILSYSGASVSRVEGAAFDPAGGGWMQRPVQSLRTFIGTGTRTFEVRGTQPDDLRLNELLPADAAKEGWPQIVVFEDSTLVFVGRFALYELAGDALQPVWKPEAGSYIVGPADANRFTSGKLIVTTMSASAPKMKKLQLVAHCGER